MPHSLPCHPLTLLFCGCSGWPAFASGLRALRLHALLAPVASLAVLHGLVCPLSEAHHLLSCVHMRPWPSRRRPPGCQRSEPGRLLRWLQPCTPHSRSACCGQSVPHRRPRGAPNCGPCPGPVRPEKFTLQGLLLPSFLARTSF